MRAGQYKGWLPTLFVGQLLQGATVGIVGAGRIGAAYARMVRTGAREALRVLVVMPRPRAFLLGAAAAALLWGGWCRTFFAAH